MTAQERIRAALVKETSSDAHAPLEVPPADKPTKITVTQEPVSLSEGVLQDEQGDVETTLPLLAGQAEDVVRRSADSAGLATSSRAEPLVTRHSVAGAAAARRSKRLLRIYITAGALVAVTGLFMFFLRTRTSTGGASTAAASGLDLKLESQASGLLDLRWNAQNPRVAQAREARLTIRESNQQSKIMTLGPDQLKIGHLYYDSSADGQEFRLEVVDASGATLAASVRAPSAPKPATPVSEPADTAKPESAAKTAIVSNAEPKTAKTEVAKLEQPVEPAKPQIRSFTPPPSTPRTNRDERPVLLDAPPVAAGGTVAAPSLPLPVAVNNLPAPPIKEAAPPPPPAAHKVGGHLEPAKLIKRVTPIYPSTARAARVQGSVRFMATIGKDGRVSNLQLVSGHALLVQAAKDAVRQWVYQPTMLNGEPVSVVTQIEVNFGLAQ